MPRKFTYKGIDGKDYSINWGGNEGFIVNDWLGARAGEREQLEAAIKHFVTTGRMPIASDVGATPGQWKNITKDMQTWMNANGLEEHSFKQYTAKGGEIADIPAEPGSEAARQPGAQRDEAEVARNIYYKELYDLDRQGGEGRKLYDELAGSFNRQGQMGVAIADAQFQDAAMQQAATVKSITDGIRNERMARLKAGMSPAQLANSDMQMMMANVNTLNQNQQMMNQARLEAQGNSMLYRDQAFGSYLEQANARGQVATGMYAADAGNADYAAQQMAWKTGKPYDVSHQAVTETEPNKN